MTEQLILQRWSNHPEHGTLGELYFEGEKLAETIEKPWRNNQPFISCVPCGTYELIPFWRSNGDDVYALFNPELNVYVDMDDRPSDHGRYGILIHIANWASEVVGCIAPGLELGVGKKRHTKGADKMMVYKSADACDQIFNLIRDKRIEKITILPIKCER